MKFLLIQIDKYFEQNNMSWVLLLLVVIVSIWVVTPYIRSYIKSDKEEKLIKTKIIIKYIFWISIVFLILIFLTWMGSK